MKTSKETITHFQCKKCKKWWTIGDPDIKKKIWWCPWCGVKREVR